jgi:hypothetical protein
MQISVKKTASCQLLVLQMWCYATQCRCLRVHWNASKKSWILWGNSYAQRRQNLRRNKRSLSSKTRFWHCSLQRHKKGKKYNRTCLTGSFKHWERRSLRPRTVVLTRSSFLLKRTTQKCNSWSASDFKLCRKGCTNRRSRVSTKCTT